MSVQRVVLTLGGTVVLVGAVGLTLPRYFSYGLSADAQATTMLASGATQDGVPAAPPSVAGRGDAVPATEGLLWRAADQRTESSLTVQAAPGRLSYLVRLYKEPGHSIALVMYCGQGQTHTVPVSVGSYTMSYTFGERWYGFPKLFGDTMASGERDGILRFEDARNGQFVRFGAPEPYGTISQPKG